MITLVMSNSRSWAQFLYTFVMIHYLQWMWPMFGIFYVLYAYGYGPVVALSLAVYIPSYLDNSERTGGRPWHAFRTHWIMNLASDYVGLEVIRQEELDPNKQYLFGYHPHGILILSRIASYGGIWEKLFPGIETRGKLCSARRALRHYPLNLSSSCCESDVSSPWSSRNMFMDGGSGCVEEIG